MTGATHEGRCLCGAVSFTVSQPLRAGNACHCSQCRRQSGHYWASTEVPRDAVTLRGMENVTWYEATPKARRGFCKTCGSFLFWDVPARSKIEIAMGAFEAPTGTTLAGHIFVADKGDYYVIADGLPQHDQSI